MLEGLPQVSPFHNGWRHYLFLAGSLEIEEISVNPMPL
ncbi:hypothetical protein AM1_B0149 (plasmid) [Acaryochloris marina MBIC11017]|uniref:Uncharacterized protein n=1 Tax=Acaryochloris marina (strain MBIC 11017) TaxID=329726 RepID=A8ZL47_ACAM1|nr:hypothetical protein AM1_B0149 [Acaryochloris marina MBIC11017]